MYLMFQNHYYFHVYYQDNCMYMICRTNYYSNLLSVQLCIHGSSKTIIAIYILSTNCAYMSCQNNYYFNCYYQHNCVYIVYAKQLLFQFILSVLLSVPDILKQLWFQVISSVQLCVHSVSKHLLFQFILSVPLCVPAVSKQW